MFVACEKKDIFYCLNTGCVLCQNGHLTVKSKKCHVINNFDKNIITSEKNNIITNFNVYVLNDITYISTSQNGLHNFFNVNK